jgi:hypothetical protein
VESTVIAECYWPGVSREAALAADARARRCAGEAGLRYLGSLHVPGDELVLFEFGAGSADEVRDVAARAGLPADRVVEAERL